MSSTSGSPSHAAYSMVASRPFEPLLYLGRKNDRATSINCACDSSVMLYSPEFISPLLLAKVIGVTPSKIL